LGEAKLIRVAPVDRKVADAAVKRWHYSGKVVNNSQLHLGVWLGGDLLGAMQFGPSLDKRKLQGLVEGTPWNGFIELNRMAFSDALPRNSESRAIAVAMRLFRTLAPHIQWVVSFADGAQCGDGAIYRASGFALTGLRKNTSVWAAPGGETFSRTSLTDGRSKQQQQQAQRVVSRTTLTKGAHMENGAASMRPYRDAGFRPIEGFQLRYIYFIDPTARSRLTVPALPFSAIDAAGARMYRGERPSRAGPGSCTGTTSAEGGSTPTPALQF
jgi:hypothetical protein